MKIRVTFELNYDPSEIATDLYQDVTEQFLSDWDLYWMVEEGWMTNAEVEVLEYA